MRQLTKTSVAAQEKSVSKLPMRQLTNLHPQKWRKSISKLPMRQLTLRRQNRGYDLRF